MRARRSPEVIQTPATGQLEGVRVFRYWVAGYESRNILRIEICAENHRHALLLVRMMQESYESLVGIVVDASAPRIGNYNTMVSVKLYSDQTLRYHLHVGTSRFARRLAAWWNTQTSFHTSKVTDNYLQVRHEV